MLTRSLTASIGQLLAGLEARHGPQLTSRALAYLTAARAGLADQEMEDLLSLDDTVLDSLFQYSLPARRRVPALLWPRLRADLPGYLADCEAGGVVVTNWYHRQFREAAKQRYLGEPGLANQVLP